MALFIIPYKLEQRQARLGQPKVPNPKVEKVKNAVKGFFKKIWAKIPKYADLHKKNN